MLLHFSSELQKVHFNATTVLSYWQLFQIVIKINIISTFSVTIWENNSKTNHFILYHLIDGILSHTTDLTLCYPFIKIIAL